MKKTAQYLKLSDKREKRILSDKINEDIKWLNQEKENLVKAEKMVKLLEQNKPLPKGNEHLSLANAKKHVNALQDIITIREKLLIKDQQQLKLM